MRWDHKNSWKRCWFEYIHAEVYEIVLYLEVKKTSHDVDIIVELVSKDYVVMWKQ